MKKQTIILLSLLIGSSSVYAGGVHLSESGESTDKIHAAHSNIQKEQVSNEGYNYKEENHKEHILENTKNNSCMKRGYEMIEEFNRLMAIPKGETEILSKELKESEIWIKLKEDEKKLLAKFLFKTNKTEDKKTQIKFKKELIKSIMKKCKDLK